MKYAAGVLVLLLAPRGSLPPASPPAVPLPAIPDGTRPFDLAQGKQEWLADPVLPAPFEESVVEWPDEALTFEIPPLAAFAAPPLAGLLRPQDPGEAEPSFPRAITGLDVERWRAEDDLRRVREWISDGTLGLPMLVPQLVVETFLPRGIAVGPSTFLYRTSPASASLALVVFDQILFHEAEFLAAAQSQATDEPVAHQSLSSGQRRLLRRAFMGGFRATYAIPGLTMDVVLQTAEEQGILGYVLAPPIGGALLYLKGIDQKIRLHDDLRVRFKLAAGHDWVDHFDSDSGFPVLSIELKFCDLPIGLIGSFDVSRGRLVPEFIGLGTSLDAVEELLGREESVRRLPHRDRDR
jgi:hypothetical protein